MQSYERLLNEKGIKYIRDDAVASRSTFKVGGVADISVFPKSVDELCFSLLTARRLGIKFEVIGNASNILFAFERYCGALVFTSGVNSLSVEGERLWAECGVSLARLASVALEASLTGLEFAFGIPGRLGGSVFMNAGAHGSEMARIVEFTDALDLETGKIIRITEHNFGYRRSVYMENRSLICLGASLTLARAEQGDIRERMRENTEKRRTSQPLELPSAGSYFKRPEGDFAGRLIEECGLKGERVGGAQVSVKHAGFIVNCGGASYRDVLALEEKIREKVMSRFDVLLCREVRLVED